jgi:hypothetical protein
MSFLAINAKCIKVCVSLYMERKRKRLKEKSDNYNKTCGTYTYKEEKQADENLVFSVILYAMAH